MKSEANRFSDTITVKCLPRLTATLNRAVERECTTPSEYIRRSLIAQLRADGFDLAHAS